MSQRAQALLDHLLPRPVGGDQLYPSACEGQSSIPLDDMDEASEGHGGIIVARALYGAGVRQVFTLSGGHISPILVGCKNEGIRVIDVRDEASAVFAADAMGRLTGIPGVAVVTAGPGLTNTITALKNAQLAESPLLVLGGATALLLKNRGALQDIDQHALMAPHCKRIDMVKSVKDVWPSLRQAVETALSDVPGPVFLEFPLEVLYPQKMIREQLGASQPEPGFSFSWEAIQKKLTHRYLENHIRSVYGNGQSVRDSAQRVFRESTLRIPAYPSLVKEAVHVLRRHQKVLLLVGSQAVRYGETEDAIRAIEAVGAPVYLSGMARGLLGVSHPLLMRHNRSVAIAQADCIFLIGVSLDFRLNYGRQIRKSTYLAMINGNAEQLRKNADLRHRDLSVLADPSLFLRSLAETLSQGNPIAVAQEWVAQCRARDNERNTQIDSMLASAPASSVGVHPLFLCSTINKVMNEDSVIVADGGDFIGTASYTVFPRRPLSWLDPGAFGTLGVGGGMALAAKAARPSAEVWLLYGDGSSAYSLAEIDSCVRHKLPVIAVIGNDAAWMQILREQVPILGDDVGCRLRPETRYDIVGQGYGGEGILVRTPEEVEPALMQAKLLVSRGIPVVVNVLLTKSQFREGSISV